MRRTALVLAFLIPASCAAPQPAANQFFDSDGTSIHYRVTGEGPPVILIHGYSLNLDQWRTVVPALSDEFMVVSMDMRGHGLSGKPHDRNAYGIDLVDDVVRLMDHLGLEQAHVAGYSLGSWIALKTASMYPDRVSSVILGGGGLSSSERLARTGAYVADALRRDIPIAEAIAPDSLPLPDSVSARIIRYINANDRMAMRELAAAAGELGVPESAAKSIAVPVAAILGSGDGAMSAVQRLVAVHPETRVVVIPGFSHFNAFRTPEFAAAMLAFLRDVEADEVAGAEPSPRMYHSLVYHNPTERMILTGGYSAHAWTPDLFDMWSFRFSEGDAGAWKSFGAYRASRTPGDTAAPANAMEPVFDSGSNRIVVLNSRGETWALEVETGEWTNMRPDPAPATRCGHNMAYDAESDRIILFGGFACTGAEDPIYAETWAYDLDANTWTQMRPETSPPARMYFPMIYDAESDRVVLWGGRTWEAVEDNAVWSYDFNRNHWTRHETAGGPPEPLAYAAMVYRPEVDDIVMLGGAVLTAAFAGDPVSSMWRYELNSNEWERITTSGGPPALANQAMAYDPETRRLIAFGGEVNSLYSNELLEGTWIYDFETGRWFTEP